MAVYAVGDIQGCYKPLRKLLRKVKFDAKKDKLWCVGDLVNRGPDSLKTLRFLKDLGDACVCVLGNHDLHLLELAAGNSSYRSDTLTQVIDAPDCPELIRWLRHRPMIHHDAELGWTMVHAGLHPNWTLKKALKRARKVEVKLRGAHWHQFCQQLHDVKFPVREPEKTDPMRLMFTTAVLTRARYCTNNGLFQWNVRTAESSSHRDKAWFSHKGAKWQSDTHVVYGHWAAKGLVTDQPHVLGLDSGCVWGNALTLAKLKKSGQFRIVAQAYLSTPLKTKWLSRIKKILWAKRG